MLKVKLNRAQAGLAETKEAFEALTSSLSQEQVNEWKTQEEEAMLARGESLDIYDVQMEKGSY
jgi:hypothetical protein